MAPTPGRSSIGVRVRPNANDFIKDLERQLAQKKKTFYVDVHANLKPANKDIAEWSRVQLKKVRAVVPVAANLIQATVDVADWRRKQRAIKTNIPIGVELGKAYSQMLTFRKIAGKDIEVDLKVNVESANKAADRFQQAMARRGVSVPLDVDLDRNAVQRTAKKIDTDLIHRLQSQGGVLLNVDANTAPAQAKVKSFTAQKPRITSQLDLDTKKANLELKLLKIRAAKEKLNVNVDVQRSRFDRFQDDLDNLSKKFGKATFIRSIDAGPFTLGKPSGLVGTLTTITALAGAVPGAVTAVTSLSKVLIDLAGAAAIVPGAIGGVLASIGTFTLGTSRVSDTLSAMFDVWNEGASSQASTARRAVQANNQLTNAVHDEAVAQREVATARREATNDLRNLTNELRGSVLNEAQAILDVQKARDTLAKGGFDSITDMKQAQLDVAKADQSLVEVRERNAQLQVKANDESAKGVEGSDRVQSALENQTKAAQATAQAMEAIASSQATGVLGKFNDLLAQLSPNAQQFVNVFANAKGELSGFRSEIENTIFQGLGPALQGAFTSVLPSIEPGMKAIAQGLNQNILAVFDTLKTPEGKSIIERILGGTAEAQKALTGLVNPLVRGLGTLMAAGAEHLPQIVNLITQLADRFADFVTSDPKGLDEFMDRGVKALGQIAEIGINAIKIVNDLSNAFDGDLLQTIEDLTTKLHNFLASDEGQQKMKNFIKEAKGLWEDWKPVLKDLPGILQRVSDVAAAALRDVILPALNGITSALEKMPWLIEAFAGLWIGVKMASAISAISKLGGLIGTMVANMGKIPGLIKNMPTNVPTINPNAPGPTAPGTAPGSKKKGGGVPGQTPGKTPGTPVAGFGGPLFIAATIIPWANEGAQDFPLLHPTRVKNRKTLLDWVNAGTNNEDKKKRAEWVAQNYPDEHSLDRDPLDPVLPAPGSYAGGGFTAWPRTVGRPALLHGKEYVEPADTVQHYGVGAMKAIHEKRVPKDLLNSFEFGGFNWPFPMAPHLGDPLLPGTPTTPTPAAPGPVATPTPPPATQTHGPPPGGTPVNAAPVPGVPGMVGPAPGPVVAAGDEPTRDGQLEANSLANTPVGPMATDQNKQSINIFGIDIPINGSGQQQQQQPNVDFSDPKIWPFGVPGIGAPGTTKEDAGKWLADWGAKTIGGFGEAVLGGVLGFFGAEGILDSPYFNAMRQTLGYYSSLPGAVSNATAPGAEDTAAAVDQDLSQYYATPGNPATGAPGVLPQLFDASGNVLLPKGVGDEQHLQLNTISAKRAISAQFPNISNIGGWRPNDPYPDHPSGQAIDVMLPRTDKGALDSATGEQVAQYALANAGSLGVDYVIWNHQIIYTDKRGAQPYTGDNPHTDHVHVHTTGGGYPKGDVPDAAPGTVVPGTAAADPTAVADHGWGGAGAPATSGTSWADVSPHGFWSDYQGPMPQSNTESVRQRHLPKGYHPTPKKSQSIGIKQAAGPLLGPNQASVPLTIGGQPVTDWSKYKGNLKQMARGLYMQSGMPAGEWDAFDRLIEKESSWDPTAKNPQSTAYGLGQFLDTTDAEYGPRTDNPFVQLPRIFQYVRNRYHGSPAEALRFHNQHNWYDKGGWLPPGQTHVTNMTGKPELVIPWDKLGFQGGGMVPLADPNWEMQDPKFPGVKGDYRGTIEGIWGDNEMPIGEIPWHTQQGGRAGPGPGPGRPDNGVNPGFTAPGLGPGQGPGGSGGGGGKGWWAKMPGFWRGGLVPQGAVMPSPGPLPRPPDARRMVPPSPRPSVGPAAPPSPPPMPAAPPSLPAPSAPTGPAVPPSVPTPEPTVKPVVVGPGPGAGANAATGGSHLNPAVQKGIRSGFATAGNLASMAAGAAGIPGAGLLSGAFGQFGKIAEGIANVGASFLVGTLTNGTTENPYGVTQRGSNPTGGTTTVVDRSTNMGDVTTQNPDAFFKQLDLREAQSRAMLGRFG